MSSDWDNKPVIPKIPGPHPPVDCDGCHDQYPLNEIHDRAELALCPDCTTEHDQHADRQQTRQLAYAA